MFAKIKNLVGFLDKVEETIPADVLVEYRHRFFSTHLSRGGYEPESRHVVGRVDKSHVVIGRIFRYGSFPVFRAAVLNNWDWLGVDPPQPILSEHHYWEAVYQMGVGVFSLSAKDDTQRKTYTPAFYIEMLERVPIEQRVSIEMYCGDRFLYSKFMNTKNHVLAEAVLVTVSMPRDFETLLSRISKGDASARKDLAELILRKYEQGRRLGVVVDTDVGGVIEKIKMGKVEHDIIRKIMSWW